MSKLEESMNITNDSTRITLVFPKGGPIGVAEVRDGMVLIDGFSVSPHTVLLIAAQLTRLAETAIINNAAIQANIEAIAGE